MRTTLPGSRPMSDLRSNPRFSHLECSRCHAPHDAARLQNLCPCGAPLLARYRLESPWKVDTSAPGLWRYASLLPVDARSFYLGEGGTPIVRAPLLAGHLGLEDLWLKDESRNPTGSFKDRGLVLAVAMAAHLGAGGVVAPSAGNAAAAMAVYAARYGLEAAVVMPRDVPESVIATATRAGADIELVDALIDGAGHRAQEIARERGYFNVSTLAEPYRVEGKKTMGLELVEQLGDVPDVIIYPLGGGTGIVGMDKAFDELEALGWLGHRRPRMIAVQAAGCAPVVRARDAGAATAEPWEDAHTFAHGLRVPRLRGDALVLAALARSGGTAIAVEDTDGRAWMQRVAAEDGILLGPESGCAVAGLAALVQDGLVTPDERVVLFHTGGPYGQDHVDLAEQLVPGS